MAENEQFVFNEGKSALNEKEKQKFSIMGLAKPIKITLIELKTDNPNDVAITFTSSGGLHPFKLHLKNFRDKMKWENDKYVLLLDTIIQDTFDLGVNVDFKKDSNFSMEVLHQVLS
jgi:hypothetical protein